MTLLPSQTTVLYNVNSSPSSLVFLPSFSRLQLRIERKRVNNRFLRIASYFYPKLSFYSALSAVNSPVILGLRQK